ncbi:MAG: D-inositol-3-phosphate glycosyltransferase [Chroococcidiopsis cubana SAG 39.79]|uniref:Glycosyl transferase n=1 Tax=Chroococcidiopsis cubana SAG 39.79 TaxID=388085 RepID=A0AB37UBA0_9CYAN|nr:glycosyltransferase [Chroococcidiopsis cubana]MDZ4871526.1 D-inositol-3-phosphate glycosyltransferase [Chroococcidiopsis cubana SAG 39.79]PSB64739.1 glycosyltransferase WbuB [Chroococcidiopsis cubana CCALA 043]RUT04172.1 glycosyl transferase [Chroococcidiopsis cubana SAG 39.79]
MKQCLGYLSGAPRVSTDPEAETSGPRSHVLGVMKAFEALNWEVKPFIVGDRVPRKWAAKGSEKTLTRGFLPRLIADLVRLTLGAVNASRAWQELGGQVDWVYERFAVLQSIGKPFKRHGVPWILETNGLIYREAKAERKTLVLSRLARLLEIQCYQNCDVLICVSNALKEMVVQEDKALEGKILVVPNGVDTEFFNPDKYSPRRLFEGFTVGFVGTLAIWQGLDLLLKAISTLKEEGVPINLVVVGDGLMRKEWEALTHNLGLSSQVCFLGQVARTEVPSLIARFDVGYSGHLEIKASKVYYSPLKLYEYMAMGKPVVVSAVEDAQSLVCEGKTGFLFQPGDREGIKQALTRAYKAQKQLKEMGCKARQEIVAKHSWIARSQSMIEGIEQILKAKRQ